MTKNESKILAQLMAGIFGGTVAIVTAGLYISQEAVPLSIITAAALISGILIVEKKKIKNYSKLSIWLGIGSLIAPILILFIPALIHLLIKFPLDLDMNFSIDSFRIMTYGLANYGLMILAALFFFIAAAAIISMLIIGLLNSKKIFLRKK